MVEVLREVNRMLWHNRSIRALGGLLALLVSPACCAYAEVLEDPVQADQAVSGVAYASPMPGSGAEHYVEPPRPTRHIPGRPTEAAILCATRQ